MAATPQIKRAYLPPASEDGIRVLVDRIWPRGLRKSQAAIDRWIKDLAPSTELRRWYGHDVERFEEFARRYRAELRRPPTDALDRLLELARTETITLVTATRDVEHSGARVLQELLATRRYPPRRRRPPPVAPPTTRSVDVTAAMTPTTRRPR